METRLTLTVTRRVPNPSGGYLGVRVASGRMGWWAGVREGDYDRMESELEAAARANAEQETRERARKARSNG